jgi:hypothetical protein
MTEEIFRAYSHKPAFGTALSEPQRSNHLKSFNNAGNALTCYLFRPERLGRSEWILTRFLLPNCRAGAIHILADAVECY